MLICMYEMSLSTLYLHHMCYVVLLAQVCFSSWQALRSNLSYPGYAWIIPGWYEDEWWQSFDSNCSLGEFGDFISSSVIVVSHYPNTLNDSAVTAIGIVSFSSRHV